MHQEVVIEFFSVLPNEIPFCSFLPLLVSEQYRYITSVSNHYFPSNLSQLYFQLQLQYLSHIILSASNSQSSLPLIHAALCFFSRSALEQRCFWQTRVAQQSVCCAGQVQYNIVQTAVITPVSSEQCPFFQKFSLLTKHWFLSAIIEDVCSIYLFLNCIVFINDTFPFL